MTTPVSVAFLDDYHDAYEASPGIARLREHRDEIERVVVFRDPVGPEDLAGFDVLVATRERTQFTREFLERLADVRLIVQTGSKAYHVDHDAAREQGILVAMAAGGSAGPTAEFTVALVLSVTRGVPFLDAAVRAGQWPLAMGRSLQGRTLGLVGFGHVGREVASRAEALGMRVAAWSPSLVSGRRSADGVEVLPLERLAGESDVLSIHCALNEHTRGLVDAGLLARMPEGSFLVNTSRGAVVDERALLDALDSGRLAGAALDVFIDEPLPPEHPLRGHPRVVVTPHVGWVADRTYEAFAATAADLVLDWLDGVALPTFDD